MKKLHILQLFIFIFSFSYFCNAQQWDSLSAGVKYIANGEGDPGIYSQISYNNNLYVGGYFDTAGKIAVRNIAEWNGANWFNVDSGTELNGSIFTLCVYNGELYAGGDFDSIGGKAIGNIAKWNGTTWSAVGLGMKNDSIWGIYSMCVYNGNLYIAGRFDSIGGIVSNNIARWNGLAWLAVGLGISIPFIDGGVTSLCVYQNKLYAGGFFDSAGVVHANSIASWDGTNWSGINSGVNGYVTSMVVFNDSLYIAGGFDTVGGKLINDIATWNGLNWSPVGKGIPYIYKHTSRYVASLCVYDSSVIAGGSFDTAGGIRVNNITFWNGTNWGTFNNGIGSLFSVVYSVYTFNSTLYAGGEFLTAGGIPANNIAQWTGPLAVPKYTVGNEQLAVYPNPSNGEFTVSLTGSQNFGYSIEVYTVFGQKVLTSSIKNGASSVINLSSQPDGVYFYRVVTDIGELIGEGKLEIMK